ncbi:hypothetical protein IW148_003700 [Coemansia sp. RSA 1199]|nr:hypothetical protein IW148_003700 [Coemansia sp. RSA 1199]
MGSEEEYFKFVDDNSNDCITGWSLGTPLSEYIDNNPSFFAFNQDPVFLCMAQNQFMHRESILDERILQPEETYANVRVLDGVEINVELYNNDNAKVIITINNGSDTFGDIKEECERVLLLTSDMPIIGWMVDGQDVDASDKVFDHITRPGQLIVAVTELLQNCKL